MNTTEIQEVEINGKDFLKEAGKTLECLDEHPGIGMIMGGALATGGVLAMLYYGSIIKR